MADDHAAARLTTLLADAGVTVLPLPHEGATRRKVRVRSSGQSLTRRKLAAGPRTASTASLTCDAVGGGLPWSAMK